jgi:hypothetical protein
MANIEINPGDIALKLAKTFMNVNWFIVVTSLVSGIVVFISIFVTNVESFMGMNATLAGILLTFSAAYSILHGLYALGLLLSPNKVTFENGKIVEDDDKSNGA